MSQIVLARFSGPDSSTVTCSIFEALADAGVRLLDVGQAVIHDQLVLGLLLELSDPHGASELKAAAQVLGLHCALEPIAPEAYEAWVSQQGRPRFIVTALGRSLSAASLAAVTRAISQQGLCVDDIVRLSGRAPLNGGPQPAYTAVEFSLRGEPLDEDVLRGAFLEIAGAHSVDIAIQRDDVYRRNRRLIAFDMDSTLIQVEVINELAAAAGVGEQVAVITEAAMRGELDFDASFRKRLGLLRGLDASVLEGIAAQLPLTEGAERLFKALRHLGFKTAIISGGFQYFGLHLQRLLGVDYVLANELEVVDGKVTGEVRGEIVNGDRKAAFLQEIAARENIDLRQVIAVGDGANDLPMLRLAGLGIAFRAKPIVRQGAKNALSVAGLDAILYLIGVRDRETMEALG